jgi:hypothetical protein
MAIYLAATATGQQQAAPAPAREATRFVTRRHGFSFETPDGWHVARGASDGLPLLANFPWSDLQGQGLLPKGGATIHIQAEAGLPGKNGSYSLDDWADFDKRTAASGTEKTRNFEMPSSSGVARALFVSFDEATYSHDIQQQHDSTVYWEFRGERLATRLNFAVGDPKGKDYEKTLGDLMRSIRPIPTSEGRKLQR